MIMKIKTTFDVSASTVKQLLDCDLETGRLFWRLRPLDFFKSQRDWRAWNSLYAFHECFLYRMNSGYLSGRIMDRNYLAHRVIWAWANGKWPTALIDHKNRDKADNRIENLREATYSENGRNRKGGRNATSSFLGVSLCGASGKWRAVIQDAGKHRELGKFAFEVDAARAYDQAARSVCGEFAYVNLPLDHDTQTHMDGF